MTTMNTYLTESARTAATEAHWDNVTLGDFACVMRMVNDAIEHLDDIKKSVFYNKPYKKNYVVPEGFHFGRVNMSLGVMKCDPDIFHSVVGILTEAQELSGALTEFGEGFCNQSRLMDEAGDLLWYLAMLFRALNTSFEEVAELNLEKLRVRYPDRFDQGRAKVRDEDKERSVFESR